MQRLRLEGQRFGRLVVLESADVNKHGKTIWLCQCDCGKKATALGSELKHGHTLSCKCLQKEASYLKLKSKGSPGRKNPNFKHGHASMLVGRSPEYETWASMHSRCRNQHERYYGARGIRVCDRWLSFDNFLSDMGRKPGKGRMCSIDRINNNGNYEPGNCRWTTPKQQAANRRIKGRQTSTPQET